VILEICTDNLDAPGAVSKDKGMHIYVLGIAGAGVSALASILASDGHTVIGSDEGVYPPVSTYLDRIGVPYFNGFAAAHVPAQVDLAIVGTSAKLGAADNPELTALINQGVPRYTFAAYLGEYVRDRETVVVAGSFGKSTLSAMIAVILRAAGRDPGYFIGAVPLDLDRTGVGGTSPEFILEGDEYVVSLEDRRSKFQLYAPQHTLISSIVHDHVNMFPTWDSYVAPFRDLVSRTPLDGLLVCARDYPILREIVGDRKAIWYGLGAGEGYSAIDIEIGERTRFMLTTPAGAAIPLETELLGMHNIENIVAASALILERGWASPEQLQKGVATFRGVARRLDKKTSRARAPAYEGFGSSYEKARSAIEAIQRHFPARPLVVVFEPHTFSWRNADALVWYDTVFDGCAEVVLLPPPGHGAASHKQLTATEIAARIEAAGVQVFAAANGADALKHLQNRMTGEEVVLLLSSGPLDGLVESVPAWLDGRFG
jgi:UDP-N-acetylmuramate: L-alanyl-gamma-D-glutamyl-meso-diaminopimelate ligase